MKFCQRKFIPYFVLLLCFASTGTFAQQLDLEWKPREDLNVLLPPSIHIYEANGNLADGAPVRAVYATLDLTDDNLKLRALGSNTNRQTTEETSNQNNGIFAINGGYFSGKASVSLLVSDGKVISPGLTHDVPRGGFGLIKGVPDVFWTRSESKAAPLFMYDNLKPGETAKPLDANQAVGGGPVLITDGKINVTSEEEGFGGSHILRHPRTAIGYLNEDILVMMVVDGRQKASVGVTLPELAQMMKGVGAIEAVNLDGGGSSAMVAAGEVVNIPVDIPGGNRNSLRENASALVFSEIVPSDENEIYYFDTDSPSYTEVGLWKTANLVNYYGETASRSASAEYPFNSATYTFDSIPRKNYQLASWWTVNEENSHNIAYIIHHGRRKDTVFVDQSSLSTSGKWNTLGNYNLGPNDSLEIRGTGSAGKMRTDAIRLTALKGTPELPIRGDVRIAVISDLNSGLGAADYEWQVDSIINRIPRIWKPDLVISGGDMVAGMGISDTAHLRKMWAGFEEHVEDHSKMRKFPLLLPWGIMTAPVPILWSARLPLNTGRILQTSPTSILWIKNISPTTTLF